MRTMTREKTLMWDVPAKWGSVDGALLQMQCGGLKAKIYEWMCHCNALGTSLQWNPLVIAQTMGTKYPEQEGIGIWIPPQKLQTTLNPKECHFGPVTMEKTHKIFGLNFCAYHLCAHLRMPPVCATCVCVQVVGMHICAHPPLAQIHRRLVCAHEQKDPA